MRRMTTRFVTVLGAVPLLSLTPGCASAPAPGAPPPSVAAMPVGGSGGSRRGVGLEVTARNDGTELALAASPSEVMQALQATYASLQIPLTRLEPAAGILGNEGMKMRRELGKLPLRRLFDCGGTPGMPNSETYTITASIVSSVAASGPQGSVVTTVIEASGENPNYPGSGVRCSSSGSLEEAMAKDLRARLNQRR